MQSPDSSTPIDWQEVRVRADAREWFPDRISLIAWFWDDDEPGACQPSLVARHFETKQPYPRAVKREPPERMNKLLRDEWQQAGKPATELPKLTPWQDANGRSTRRIYNDPIRTSRHRRSRQVVSRIQVWVHPEGVFTEIRFWHDIVARRFTHWRASSSETPIPCRELSGIIIAEENLLPLSVVTELALAFHSNPSVLPKHQGVFWHVTKEAL